LIQIRFNRVDIGATRQQSLDRGGAASVCARHQWCFTVEELKLALSRERRGRDRRLGRPDTRVFRYERRVGERRSTRDDIAAIDDDMIIEISVDNSDLEVELEDMTRIFTEVTASST
jgi:hypothetical protein